MSGNSSTLPWKTNRDDEVMCNISERTKLILKTIEDAGYEAYIVGGAVRDLLVGKNPSDWDIATDALPDETLAIFDKPENYRTETIGKKNGTIKVFSDLKGETVSYEITTYRIDGEYSDSRHPDHIRFSKSLEQDLLRRDFTMNAVAMDRYENIIDPLSGVKDIQVKLIKAAGDPAARFSEDALRILRGMRFEAELSELGFRIDQSTEKAMIAGKDGLKNISMERIQSEFNRILISRNAARILRKYSEIVVVFIPELRHIPDLKGTEEDFLQVRLAQLMCDIEHPLSVLERLKYSRKITKDTLFLIENQRTDLSTDEIDVRKKLGEMGEERLNMLISFQTGYLLSQSNFETNRIKRIREFQNILERTIEEKMCVRRSELAISGKDIIELGVKEGPEVGNLLNYILYEVITDRISNDRASIMKEVRLILSEHSLN